MNLSFKGLTSRVVDMFKRQPKPDTQLYPKLMSQLSRSAANRTLNNRYAFRSSPLNLRFFSRTTYARRAISAIRNEVSSLQWRIQPINGEIEIPKKDRALIETVTAALRRPNYDISFAEFAGMSIEDMLVCGAAAFEPQVTDRLWLFPVDAQSILINPLWQPGSPTPRYFQMIGLMGSREGIELKDEELVYARLQPTTDTPYSYGPLEVAYQNIQRLLGVQDYAGNVTSNAQPENLLIAQGWSAEEIESARMFWRDEVEGQGTTPILGSRAVDKSDFKVAKLRGANDDAIYPKYQDMLVRELAAAFNLSAQNLNVESDVNRSTSETARDRDFDQAIKPCAFAFASHLTFNVLHKHLGLTDYALVYPELFRDDQKTVAEIYKTYYNTNLITPNQQRKILGMEPLQNQWADLTFADAQIAIARGTNDAKDPSPSAEPQGQPK